MPNQIRKAFVGYSLTSLLLASAVSAPAQSPIAGRITLPDGVTAIPGVNITLVGPFEGTGLNAARSNPLMASEIADATSTPQAKSTTGIDGRFRFDRLESGQYAVLAKLDGYFGSPVPGKPPTSPLLAALATVVSGEPTPDVSMTMVRGATISGRVRDSAGNPMAGATVRAYSIEIVKGPLVSFPINPKKTDAQGDYVLSRLAPGEYYIAVNPPGSPANARTYYPGVTDQTVASRTTVTDGADVVGVDIDIPAVP